MPEQKFEIYVDYKFLEGYFKNLDNAEPLSDEFEIYYSFFKIIQQPHVRLISLETNQEIKANDLLRVFHSSFDLETANLENGKYQVPFDKIKNLQSLFFGESFPKEEDYGNKYGFVFSGIDDFKENWSSLLLIGEDKKNTVHVKTKAANPFSWKSALKAISIKCNSLIFVEPFLMTWLPRTENEKSINRSKISDNIGEVIQVIRNSVNKDRFSIHVITKSDRDKSGDNGDTSININSVLSQVSEIAKEISIDSFENGKIGKRDTNFLHDRYIITNYHLIISTHSLDMIERDNSNRPFTKKNTQLIIEPLINGHYYEFYKSKIKDFHEGFIKHKAQIRSSENPKRKHFVFLERNVKK
jgi:hypothetical protein